jgi:hypothetical protein
MSRRCDRVLHPVPYKVIGRTERKVNGVIGNRTRDLSAGSIVPQLTMLTHATLDLPVCSVEPQPTTVPHTALDLPACSIVPQPTMVPHTALDLPACSIAPQPTTVPHTALHLSACSVVPQLTTLTHATLDHPACSVVLQPTTVLYTALDLPACSVVPQLTTLPNATLDFPACSVVQLRYHVPLLSKPLYTKYLNLKKVNTNRVQSPWVTGFCMNRVTSFKLLITERGSDCAPQDPSCIFSLPCSDHPSRLSSLLHNVCPTIVPSAVGGGGVNFKTKPYLRVSLYLSMYACIYLFISHLCQFIHGASDCVVYWGASYKLEGRGFDTHLSLHFFQFTYPPSRIMPLGFTQALTEKSIRNVPCTGGGCCLENEGSSTSYGLLQGSIYSFLF